MLKKLLKKMKIWKNQLDKIKARMHNYRNNDDFRKKNADYMKDKKNF